MGVYGAGGLSALGPSYKFSYKCFGLVEDDFMAFSSLIMYNLAFNSKNTHWIS